MANRSWMNFRIEIFCTKYFSVMVVNLNLLSDLLIMQLKEGITAMLLFNKSWLCVYGWLINIIYVDWNQLYAEGSEWCIRVIGYVMPEYQRIYLLGQVLVSIAGRSGCRDGYEWFVGFHRFFIVVFRFVDPRALLHAQTVDKNRFYKQKSI